MIVTYFGKACFKIQQGETVIAYNPISKDSTSGVKPARFGAQITLSSTHHPEYNGVENTSFGETVPFVIEGPGDYEVKGIFIKGMMTDVVLDGKKYINTIYTLTVDNINLCFLGTLGSGTLAPEVREKIGTPDILFVPIGGGDLLDAAQAHKLALSLETKIIIPMEYGDDMQKDALKHFLKEAGQDAVSPIEKLTIKRKDIESKNGEIVILSS
jgi:L-ascorbate metabolism protein UlaG (beta-lactamase superfamily)